MKSGNTLSAFWVIIEGKISESPGVEEGWPADSDRSAFCFVKNNLLVTNLFEHLDRQILFNTC
jgi:hypothetical protein